MKTITIKGISIGEGTPKICVPIVGTTEAQLIQEAETVRSLKPDVVEWRVDFFHHVEDLHAVIGTLEKIRNIFGNIPLLFTFRSAREGGYKTITDQYYVELNQKVIRSKMIDLVDVELFSGDEIVTQIVNTAKENGVYVVISNHDFEKTPEQEDIIQRLCKAQKLGADIPKIAVMPNSTEDVITLLQATRIMKEKYATGPIFTISMSGRGVISRIAGEVFGSDLTFAAGKEASAPGQIAVSELKTVLEVLHKNM